MLSRRGFLGFLAAPAIVRAASLMPVKMLAAEPLVFGPNMTAHEVELRVAEYWANPPLVVERWIIDLDKLNLSPGSINWGPETRPLLLGEPMTEFRSVG